METSFEFTYRERIFTIDRQVFLPYRAARQEDRIPFWDLGRLGRGIVVLAVEPADTRDDVENRFTIWLEERYRWFVFRDEEYELYRIPRDFWHPQKEMPAPSGVWEVRKGGELVTQFPESAAANLSVAIAVFIREQSNPAVECFGGPLDGERVGERGAEFEAIWEWDEHVDEDSARRVSRPHQGLYRRTKDGYQWVAG
jgi:hypothetical protein